MSHRFVGNWWCITVTSCSGIQDADMELNNEMLVRMLKVQAGP